MTTESIVWILGAGFSKPLGGPLLSDFFSEYSEHVFPAAIHGDRSQSVYETYQRGLAAPNIYPGPNLDLWTNAEEFLAYIENALSLLCQDVNTDRHEVSALRKITKFSGALDFLQLYEDALQAVASRCRFVSENSDNDAEAWKPYIRWHDELLKHGDWIVSFNYDTVTESLPRRCDNTIASSPLHHLQPDDFLGKGFKEIDYIRNPNVDVPVLKLHGSVSWTLSRDFVLRSPRGGFVVEERHARTLPFIATPGPNKLSLAMSELRPLWIAATEAIEKASAVVCLGYRFPPSDVHALSTILGAIEKVADGELRWVHIILGQDTQASDRILALLKMNRHTSSVAPVSEPFLTQDFLLRASRDYILNPDI
jgi:hypothetical protein